uniref:Uncharacterized protein n=1 Tax=Chromera velia CCMP2878 TaxID=1169474 RepID=A0A0G4HXG6_9ALVE|eukprot:Cvel_1485.t1-p1 / transcript=Cvel_1485.t1 / gene=Cvel_1485 / organism=Chromera_velia_CCMP2878 / gene_product=hypothetical protein / transcript_product=hypothetical protein / location=Cvel_scaffold52:35521-37591(-) / protein_length=86 / sequence_SO=supercontig / SO=protein_coding / is_pseudo=false
MLVFGTSFGGPLGSLGIPPPPRSTGVDESPRWRPWWSQPSLHMHLYGARRCTEVICGVDPVFDVTNERMHALLTTNYNPEEEVTSD